MQLTKKNKIGFICLLLVSNSSISAVSPTIDYPDAVKQAIKTNPRIHVQHAGVEIARANIIQARGSGLPKLNAELSAATSNNPLNVFSYKLSQGNASFADFGAAEFTGPNSINVVPSALNSPGYYENVNTGFALTIPIYSGGRDAAALKQSEHLLNAALQKKNVDTNQLKYDILEAYEGTRTSAELIQIAKASEQAAQQYLKLTEDLYHQSIVIQSDVLIAQANQRSIQTTLKATQAEYQNQLQKFRTLIGNPNSHVLPGKAASITRLHESMDALEKRALLKNSSLCSLQANIEANRAGKSIAFASHLPHIDLQLKHEWNSDHFDMETPSNTAILGLKWELFSSGADYGADKQAAAEYQRALAEYDQQANQIRLAIEQAYRAVQTAQQQRHSSHLNQLSAKKAIEILLERYGQGKIPLGQLLEGQARFDTAKAQEKMAQYQELLSRARLLITLNEFSIQSRHGKQDGQRKS